MIGWNIHLIVSTIHWGDNAIVKTGCEIFHLVVLFVKKEPTE